MKILILASIIALTLAIDPKPIKSLNLNDVKGTWYATYVMPMSKLLPRAIYCLEMYFEVYDNRNVTMLI